MKGLKYFRLVIEDPSNEKSKIYLELKNPSLKLFNLRELNLLFEEIWQIIKYVNKGNYKKVMMNTSENVENDSIIFNTRISKQIWKGHIF